jgi:iron-sulfur cluster insertion protein
LADPKGRERSHEQFMVTLTDVAQGRIRDIIQETPEAEGKVLRLFVEGGGCAGFQYGFTFDERTPDDTVLALPGFELAIDPGSAMYLMGVNIDYVESLQGAGFKIDNPNAGGGHCGCGKSFSA